MFAVGFCRVAQTTYATAPRAQTRVSPALRADKTVSNAMYKKVVLQVVLDESQSGHSYAGP